MDDLSGVARKLRERRLAVLLAVMLFFSTLVPQIPYARAATGFRLHAGILIQNNSEFTAINGVVGGLGTSSQPYIIAGWEITTGGIQISGTTAYFIIRNVYVHNGGEISLSVANGQVDNSTVTNNYCGICIVTSTNVIIDRNNVSSNIGDASSHIVGGISISRSDLVIVSGNNVSNNTSNDQTNAPVSGIGIQDSTRVTVNGNHLVSNDILPSGTPFQLSSLTIASDNTVNGRPVNFYNGCSSTTVNAGPPEELIFADCNNVHVTNTSFSNTGFGVQLLSVNGASLSGDTFSNNVKGIRVYNSTGITIDTSIFSTNSTGIEVTTSAGITIHRNNITSGDTAISFVSSKKVTVSQNRLTAGNYGINGLYSNATIDNNIVNGAKQGIVLGGFRTYDNVTDNSITNNRIGVYFSGSCCFGMTNIVSGNISRNLIMNNGDGIDIVWLGMVYVQFNINITANNISNNNNVGVSVSAYGSIHIYHNNFISNTLQASDAGSSTFWDNGYPGGGNYWSDFKGKDNCSGPRQDICPSPDGIGDTQYRIGQAIDNYPLMKLFGPADTVAPGWPTGSQISATSISQNGVTLAWTPAADDTGVLSYRLYDGNNIIATVTGATHSFQVSGLASGTVYTFKVEAVDAWGNNSTSDPSTTLQTSGAGGSGPAALLQQYWPLIAAAGAAGVALASFALLQRRRKLKHQAETTQAGIQTTSQNH